MLNKNSSSSSSSSSRLGGLHSQSLVLFLSNFTCLLVTLLQFSLLFFFFSFVQQTKLAICQFLVHAKCLCRVC